VNEETNLDGGEHSEVNHLPLPGQTSTPLIESPVNQRKIVDTSANDTTTSPLAVFASSPQAMYRRVMVSIIGNSNLMRYFGL